MDRFSKSKGFQRHAQMAFERALYQPDGKPFIGSAYIPANDFSGVARANISVRRGVKRLSRALSGVIYPERIGR